MNIPLNASVNCTDAHGGQTTCVIVNPDTRQLTHVIVEESAFPRLKRLVPVTLITRGGSSEIQLGCTTRQLATLRPFLEIEDPRNGTPYFTYEVDEFRRWPYETPTKMPVSAELERVLPGELPIHHDSLAYASDGQIGRVKAIRINPTSHSLIAIGIEAGHFWNRQELIISAAQVDHFEEDLIFLKLDRH